MTYQIHWDGTTQLETRDLTGFETKDVTEVRMWYRAKVN